MMQRQDTSQTPLQGVGLSAPQNPTSQGSQHSMGRERKKGQLVDENQETATSSGPHQLSATDSPITEDSTTSKAPSHERYSLATVDTAEGGVGSTEQGEDSTNSSFSGDDTIIEIEFDEGDKHTAEPMEMVETHPKTVD